MKREEVRTQLIAWLLLPVVGILLAAGLNFLLVVKVGFPLVLYLLWGFPWFEELTQGSRQALGFDLATWVILYLHALWLPALFLFFREKKRSGTAAALTWGATLVACIVSFVWQAI